MKTKRLRLKLMLPLIVLLTLAAWLWFSPSDTGEYANSPDGRYQARASNEHRGTLLHGRIAYIQIELVDNATGQTIWTAQRYPAPAETPPDFGDRSKTHIHWSPDSRTVSIPVGSPTDAIFSVP